MLPAELMNLNEKNLNNLIILLKIKILLITLVNNVATHFKFN